MFDRFNNKQDVTVHDIQSYVTIISIAIVVIGVGIHFLVKYHKKDFDVRVRRNLNQINCEV